MAKAELQAFIESHKLTMRAVFVPWSQSRNKGEKDERGKPRLSLNWVITIAKDGRDFLITDYSAGIGHCPSAKKKAPQGWPRPEKDWPHFAAKFETEQGFEPLRWFSWQGDGLSPDRKKPILPDFIDVLYSLAMDSDVLEYPTFEQWAAEFGYDADSRKAETIYRACLEIALKMRAALGDAGLSALRDAAQDY